MKEIILQTAMEDKIVTHPDTGRKIWENQCLQGFVMAQNILNGYKLGIYSQKYPSAMFSNDNDGMGAVHHTFKLSGGGESNPFNPLATRLA